MRRSVLVAMTFVTLCGVACGGGGSSARGTDLDARSHRVYRYPGESMQPALKMNQRFTIQPVRSVHRGDIVALHAPEAFPTPPDTATDRARDLVVRRIVGMPGETIQGRAGQVYIDGRPLREPYLGRSVSSRTFGPISIPSDAYFVLGDNRQYSKDSTSYGPLPSERVAGRVET